MVADTKQLQVPAVRGGEVLPGRERLIDLIAESDPTINYPKIRQMVDAWVEGSLIDARGNVWLDMERLHFVIRHKALADLNRFFPDPNNTLTIGNTRYLRGVKVADLIDSVISHLDSPNDIENRILRLLKKSKELYLEIRNCKEAKIRQDSYLDGLANLRNDLKDRKIKRSRLVVDELTNESLNTRSAQFVFIRAPFFRAELSGSTANGFVINRETYEIVRKYRPTDEKQFFRLCKAKGWNTDWYKGYREKIGEYLSRDARIAV